MMKFLVTVEGKVQLNYPDDPEEIKRFIHEVVADGLLLEDGKVKVEIVTD